MIVPVFGAPRATRQWVRAAVDSSIRFEASPQDGPPEIREGKPPVCVALERFPEEWGAGAVRRLLDRFPLSAWVVACGSWANGGARTGSPWPIAIRCGQAEARQRVRRAIRGEAIPGPLLDGGQESAPPAGVGPVRVVSPDRAYRRSLETLLAGTGPTPWEVWDLDSWDERRAAALTRARLHQPERVRLGMTSFASPSRITPTGLDRVLSKWDPPAVVWAAAQGEQGASAP